MTNTNDLLISLGWDTPDQRIYKKRMTLVYKALHGNAPNYIQHLLPSVTSIHNRALRSSSSNNLYIEGGRSEMHLKRFSYLAPSQWNLLPTEVKCAVSLSSFKNKLNKACL